MESAEEERRRRRREAVELSDRVRAKSPPGYDSTEVIRFWRDTRYGRGWAERKKKANRSS